MLGTIRNRCRSFLSNGKNLKAAWLITAGVVALYLGGVRAHEFTGSIANSKSTGLVSESAGMWRAHSMARSLALQEGRSSVDDALAPAAGVRAVSASLAAPPTEDFDRKIVRTESLDIVVGKPAETVEKIGALAELLGGFLVESQINGGEGTASGSLTIRVPAVRFEQARAEIRKLALRIEGERIEAQDATREYVDKDAALRNLRAEESQYLSILKQARTVKDTLEVSDKLNDVRGQINQQQAEFQKLSKQIETVGMTVTMRTASEVRVFGLNWQPLYRVKLAIREGLDGLADYASSMTEFVFLLPSVLLWLTTVVAGAAFGWQILRWAGQRLFRAKRIPAEARG
jgi:hypothetical protein